MKKIYLIFFTLILGAMVVPKAQAQTISDCVNDIFVNADANDCSTFINFDDPGCSGCLTDGSGSYYVYELAGATVDTIFDSQRNFNTGVTDVLAILFNSGGTPQDSCEFSVTVTDINPPVVDCQDVTIYADSTGNATLIASNLDDGTTDNCVASLTFTVNGDTAVYYDCDDIGATINVWMVATDPGGNKDSCQASVTVMDTLAPVAICKTDTTVALDALGEVTLPAIYVDSASYDNCEIDTITPDFSFDCSHVGSDSIVTITVSDPYGNSSTCTTTVSIIDTLPPVMDCQDFTVQLDASGNGSVTVADIQGGTDDNCAVDSMWLDNTYSFDCSDVGSNTIVTLTAEDVNGNTASCTSDVTVEDNVAPVASCQSVTVYLDNSGNATITATGGTIDMPQIDDGSSDVCGIDSMWLDRYYFDCLDADSVRAVQLTVLDVNGNTSTCDADVTVKDTIPPTAVCQNIDLYLDEFGEATLTASDIDGGSFDNCDASFTLSIDSSYMDNWECGDVELPTHNVVLVATDAVGNTSTCTAQITVLDTVPPVALCQDVTAYLDSMGNVTVPAVDVDNGSNDACGVETWMLDDSTFTCSDQFSANTVTMTVTDVNGNTATCNANVTVLDTLAPMAVCQDVTVILDSNGEASVTDPDDIDGGSWDNCDYDSEVIGNVFTCVDIGGVNTVMLKVWDQAGFTDMCTANVTVVDDDAPTAVCKDTTLYLDGNGMIDLALTSDSLKTLFDGGSTDNTDCLTYSVMPTTLGCDDVSEGTATTAVTLTVTDAGGNTATCESNVTVLDTLPPVVEPNDLTIWLKGNGEYALDAEEQAYLANVGPGGTEDNCTADEELDITVFPISFECIDVLRGPIAVAITAVDEYGNDATANAYVTVIDTFAPLMNCVDTLDVMLDENGEALIFPGYLNEDIDRASVPVWARTLNDLEGATWDACGIDSTWISQGTFTCDDLGSNVTKLYAIDPSGNLSMCTSVINVHDDIAPTIDVVVEDTMMVAAEPGECEVEITYPTATAMDNCEATLTQVAGLGPDGMFPLGATTETWVAVDGSGNVSDTASFVVYVTTTNAVPTVDGIPDATVMEDAGTVHVDITGISDGGDCDPQDVMVYAEVTSGTAATLDTVMYTSGDDSAKLALSTVPDMNGDVMVAVTVVDAAGDSITKTMTLTVEPVNDAPVLVTPIEDQTVNASYELEIPVSSVLGEYFDDIDGDVLTLSVMLEDGSAPPAWAAMEGDMIVLSPMIADTGCVNMVVEASDGEATATDTFEVCVDGYPTSIDDLGAGEFEVNLYPNPTQGRVNVDIESSTAREIQLTVLDITGRQVLRKQYRAAERITFDMSGKVSGMYFVKLDFEGKQVLKKLVVDRK